MKSTKLIATLLVTGMLFTGCGIKNSPAIIKVNDKVITESDFQKLMDKHVSNSPLAKMGMDLKSDKNGILYLMTERGVVTQLVIEELINQEAQARGIKVTNKDIDEAVNEIIDKLGGKDNLSNILKQNNVSIKQFKSDLRTQVKMKKVAQATQKITVSDKEVQDFYNKNIDKFKHGEQVRAYHILLSTDPMLLGSNIRTQSKKELSNDEVSKQIEEKVKENEALSKQLAQELKADNSKFTEYAKKYSNDSASAEKGGDLGYFEAKVMVPEFSKAAFSAKPNTVVGPVKTKFGYHIIFVTDRKPAGTEPFDQVKNNLKESLTNEKEIQVIDDVINAAKKKATITYVDKQYDPEEITKRLTEQLSGMQKEANANNAPAKKTPKKK